MFFDDAPTMKKWAVLFTVFIVAIIVLADTRHLGFLGGLYDFPYGDKVGHFLLFGLLSLLVNLAALERRRTSQAWHVAFGVSLMLAVLIGLEEFSQRFFAARTASWMDLAASYLGVSVFAWVALKMPERRRTKGTNNSA